MYSFLFLSCSGVGLLELWRFFLLLAFGSNREYEEGDILNKEMYKQTSLEGLWYGGHW